MTPRIRAIEAEYGEPIYDIVAGYAAAGETRMSTGAILGYNGGYFATYVLPRIDPARTIQWPVPGRSAPHAAAVSSPEARANRRRAAYQRWRLETTVCIGGVCRTRAEWRRHYGISHDAVRDRMRKYGWRFERAVSEPKMSREERVKMGGAARARGKAA
jgi:hypothetical protein